MNVGAIPLIALEAVALDLEATGLDPTTDRIVEIGAVRLRGDTLKDEAPFRRLVQPGIPIPKAATAVHGINQEALSNAPNFIEVWNDAKHYFENRTLIGHTISFDLALLHNEVKRADEIWPEPTWLDVRLLAGLVDLRFSNCSLDELASTLGIEILHRHTAVGDARAAAAIFGALLPQLRACGIHTVAEAVRASNELSANSGSRSKESQLPKTVLPAAAFDTYPFRHRISDLMSAPARWVQPDHTVQAALQLMTTLKVSSLFVSENAQPAVPAKAGVFTERDAMRVLDSQGREGFAVPLAQVMSKPVISVPHDALAYVAIGRMKRLGFRHLGVIDDAGIIVGAVSARDLLRLRAQEARELTDEIEAAVDTADLASAWGRIVPAVTRLRRDGMTALEIAALISQQVVELTRAAARIAERRLAQEGLGSAPAAYAFAVLGSAARGESLLAMDQDNALIVSADAPQQSDAWFDPFTARVNEILHTAGVPYCKGGIMAKNPLWRGSINSWRERITHWVTRTTPAELLAVDVFFDLRIASGDPALGETLRLEAFDLARGDAAFAKLLLEASGKPDPAFGWFGGFRTDNGRIDLKKAGLFSLVSTTRALAIWHRVTDRSTYGRLCALRALLPHTVQDIEALIDAQSVFLELILDQQLSDATQGQPLSNRVELKRLSAHERHRLRSALGATRYLDQFAKDGMF